jgi:hypothetical protein
MSFAICEFQKYECYKAGYAVDQRIGEIHKKLYKP